MKSQRQSNVSSMRIHHSQVEIHVPDRQLTATLLYLAQQSWIQLHNYPRKQMYLTIYFSILIQHDSNVLGHVKTEKDNVGQSSQ